MHTFPAIALALSVAIVSHAQEGKQHPSFEILTHRMDVDVDGAPNAYGPPGKKTLDILLNAHYLNRADKEIVGYLTDEHDRPILQSSKDPFPGYYISQTAFTDIENHNERDPRRYVDARSINYVVRGNVARRRGVRVGDFASVYSKRTGKGVFAIVGDTGNPTGDEGSLHLLQDLGYPFHDGKNGSVEKPEIVIRFYPNSNPRHQFFFAQCELDQAATTLGLSRNFPPFPERIGKQHCDPLRCLETSGSGRSDIIDRKTPIDLSTPLRVAQDDNGFCGSVASGFVVRRVFAYSPVPFLLHDSGQWPKRLRSGALCSSRRSAILAELCRYLSYCPPRGWARGWPGRNPRTPATKIRRRAHLRSNFWPSAASRSSFIPCELSRR
jgi:hypothetical protein